MSEAKSDPKVNEELDAWLKLSSAAQDVLRCLVIHGPTWDGDVPSKKGRDELLTAGYATKMVMAKANDGYQAATYLGLSIWRAAQEAGHVM